MAKIRVVVFFLISLVAIVHTHAQWVPTALSNCRVRVIIRSGDYLVAATSRGILLSTDGYNWTEANSGITWTVWSDTLSSGVKKLVKAGNTLLAVTDHGIFRLASDATDWSLIHDWNVQALTALDSTHVILSLANGVTVSSSDAGSTWSDDPRNPWMGSSNFSWSWVRAFEPVGEYLYGSVETQPLNGGMSGVFRRRIVDSTWERVSDDVPAFLKWDAGILYAVGLRTRKNEFLESTDSGKTWSRPPGGADTVYCWQLEIVDGVKYLASMNGILRLRDGIWDNAAGEEPALRRGVMSLLFDSTVVFAGTVDSGIWARPRCELSTCSDTTAVEYSAGWNLISNPAWGPAKTVSELGFGNASTMYSFGDGYRISDTAEVGRGYWVKLDSTMSIPQSRLLRVMDSLHVVMGWNLIGSVGLPVMVDSIETYPRGIMASPVYGYSPVDGGYHPTPILEPGRAYWLKVSANGTIILDAMLKKTSSGN